MMMTEELLSNLWDLLTRHGAREVGLTFQQGGRGTWEAVLKFRWRGRWYERCAVADHTGMPGLEQLTHLTRCIFEPEHKSVFVRLLQERHVPADLGRGFYRRRAVA